MSTYIELDDMVKVLDRFVTEKNELQNEAGADVGIIIDYWNTKTSNMFSDLSTSSDFDFQREGDSISLYIGRREILMTGILALNIVEEVYNKKDYIQRMMFNCAGCDDCQLFVIITQNIFLDYE